MNGDGKCEAVLRKRLGPIFFVAIPRGNDPPVCNRDAPIPLWVDAEDGVPTRIRVPASPILRQLPRL